MFCFPPRRPSPLPLWLRGFQAPCGEPQPAHTLGSALSESAEDTPPLTLQRASEWCRSPSFCLQPQRIPHLPWIELWGQGDFSRDGACSQSPFPNHPPPILLTERGVATSPLRRQLSPGGIGNYPLGLKDGEGVLRFKAHQAGPC